MTSIPAKIGAGFNPPPTLKVLSFWMFSQPAVWWTGTEFTKEFYGLPGCSDPKTAKAVGSHWQTVLAAHFRGIFSLPYLSPRFMPVRSEHPLSLILV